MADKSARRIERAAAVRRFNVLAEEFGIDQVPARPSVDEDQALYASLCEVVPAERVQELASPRGQWCDNGGDELDEALLAVLSAAEDDLPEGNNPLPAHKFVASVPGRAFRLKSKAFMLTFNSESFEVGPSDELWAQFCSWVVDRAWVHNATHWSATIEKAGRVHAHAYFSWHGAGARGIDHRTTEA